MSASDDLRGSPMFPSEKEILDLWDSGEGLEVIAERLKKEVHYVRKIVARYNSPASNSFDRMVAAGSASLLASLYTFHPETRRGVHP